ncbi:MAG: hypothetical protein CMP22_04035 [Rickettsiales bacterium]|nr:hypothetical protein [Rickettsiales bacterium]
MNVSVKLILGSLFILTFTSLIFIAKSNANDTSEFLSHDDIFYELKTRSTQYLGKSKSFDEDLKYFEALKEFPKDSTLICDKLKGLVKNNLRYSWQMMEASIQSLQYFSKKNPECLNAYFITLAEIKDYINEGETEQNKLTTHFNDYYDASDIKTINAKLNGYQCNTQWYQDYGTWEIVVVPSKDNFELLGKPTYMECKK